MRPIKVELNYDARPGNRDIFEINGRKRIRVTQLSITEYRNDHNGQEREGDYWLMRGILPKTIRELRKAFEEREAELVAEGHLEEE